MRSSLALIAAAGVVAIALSGCSSPEPAPLASPGESSDSVQVKGEFGSAPRVSFPTPVEAEETQCTEVIEGTGPRVRPGETVQLGAALYDGKSGSEVQVIGFDDEQSVSLTIGDTTLAGFNKGLSCAREGSRVVVVVPPSDATSPSSGTAPENDIVVVFDVKRIFPSRADGAPRITPDDFPAVVLAPDGRPGITVPKADPPATTQVGVLREGAGQVVKSGDQVVVHYTGVLWDTGKVFDSSWANGQPANFTVSDDASASQVIPGFSKAIIGQKVGSQVGVIVAPGDGYGEQGSGGEIPPNATLFFVIDILGVV
ncbi:peptidylprolyl isomerase [Agromyces protaetiae]|uniref:Peptidyl-prolyl cis-trans isomerase n=1 Tax=Agromyces protaetiae TaxID=2509455 RepID=A0A4P6FDR6_9MICO|nr:FKBP-type peptidyl-prolyl cis-trans isomerase [Agromyces protaetiae]QAY74035.1 peptidylprolyl isomerase [Agromyces protaetiae]